MINNVTILNISDLHSSNSPQQRTLLNEFVKKIKEFLITDSSWKPDIILLPGDIIQSDDENYSGATDFINKLIAPSVCQLTPERVIVVPGNHDKSYTNFKDLPRRLEISGPIIKCGHSTFVNELLTRDTIKVLDKSIEEHIKKIFNQLQTDIINTEKGGAKKAEDQKRDEKERLKKESLLNILSYLKNDYKHYLEFAKPYAGTDKYNSCEIFSWDEELKLLSGYKYFPELNICFILLNSEWFTVRKKINPAPDVVVGNALVSSICKKVNLLPPETIVVTVMHRSPQELAWEEKNEINPHRSNSFYHILRTSDIIVSGHNHPLSNSYLRPDSLNGDVLHFQMGSLACSSNPGSETFSYSASLMKINFIENKVRVLPIQVKPNTANEWQIFCEAEDYPLRKKYIYHDPQLQLQKKGVAGIELPEVIEVKDLNSEELIRYAILNRYYNSNNLQEKDGLFSHKKNSHKYPVIRIVSLKKFKENYLPEIVQKKVNEQGKGLIPSFEHLICYSSDLSEQQEMKKYKKLIQKTFPVNKLIYTPVIVRNGSEISGFEK